MLLDLYWLLQDGFAPIHVACQGGHYQIVELLLQAGASVEQQTKVGLCVVIEQLTYS